MLFTFVDTIEPERTRAGRYDNQFVVYFGRPDDKPPYPDDQVLVIERFDATMLEALRSIEIPRMRGGVWMVLRSDAYAAHAGAIDAGQRLLAYIYCKYVNHPLASGKIPDPAGVRESSPPELTHEINKLRNLPWHLECPLVDKLEKRRVGLPVLLLLPGPSAREVMPHLEELARSCLVVTLARSLDICLEQGVEPDVVVQLDTYQRQRHFYPRGRVFASSCLVTLSLAPLFAFADAFRNVFIMESFDPGLLKNPYRMRESWLSSLIAGMGVAEALHAPEVYLVGADLSFSDASRRYATGSGGQLGGSPEMQQVSHLNPAPAMITDRGSFEIQGRHGRTMTTMAYLATAVEAEQAAGEIGEKTGTRFFNLTGAGILDASLFPAIGLDEVAARGAVDRRAFWDKADEAAREREEVNLIQLRMQTLKLEQTLGKAALWMRAATDSGEDLSQTPYVRAMVQVGSDNPGVRGAEEMQRMAVRFVERWRDWAGRARNVALLHGEQGKGASVPLLCLPEEMPGLMAALAARRPGWSFAPCHVRGRQGYGEDRPGNWIRYAEVYPWLRHQRVALFSEGWERVFDFMLATIPASNLLALRHAGLQYSWPPTSAPPQGG